MTTNGASLQLVEHAIVSQPHPRARPELLMWDYQFSGSSVGNLAGQEVEEIDRDLYRSKQLWKVRTTR